MKKLLLFILPVFFCTGISAQKDDEFKVKIKSPKMDALVEKLYVDLPTDCVKVPANVTIDRVEKGDNDESCASSVLAHFRKEVTKCKMTAAFKDAIKFEFKLLKLLPVGKLAGYALDVADLSAKALSANSPEEFEGDLEKFGAGKLIGDELVKKLKGWTKVPEGEEGDVLGNLAKLFLKQLWDEAKKKIFPKAEKFDCQTGGVCNDNITMSVEPYDGDNPKVMGKMVFSANGDCDCNWECKAGLGVKVNDWSLHGEMLFVVDKAEVITEGIISKEKVLQITLKAEKPTYRVQANCECPTSSNTGFDENSNSVFVGLGLVYEDAASRFSTIGGNVAYTHMVSSKLGVTADAGLYFGNNNNVDFTKIQVLGGISLPLPGSKITVSPHLLAGVANVKSKSGTSSSSSTNFAAAAGADVIANLSSKMGVGARVDYNPVFYRGGAAHNLRASAGLRIRL